MGWMGKAIPYNVVVIKPLKRHNANNSFGYTRQIMPDAMLGVTIFDLFYEELRILVDDCLLNNSTLLITSLHNFFPSQIHFLATKFSQVY